MAHAVLAATHAYGDASRTHPHLVVCALPSEAALAELFERLKLRGVPVIAYYEDDLQNQLTALATGPLTGEARRPLRHLPLLPPGG